MKSPEPTVRITQLNHYFGQGDHRKQVLYDIQLDLLPGQIVIMTGPSGSGKTTLLTLIGALRSVQEGSAQVLGRDYVGLSRRDLVRARRDIGFIFQNHNLFSSLTAFHNVRMALELQPYSRRQMKQLTVDILERVGLHDRVHYAPDRLSGGQRQRVAVARALVGRPKLILADEPTAALDEASGKDVIELLRKLADDDGATVMVVTHDNRILSYADRIVNMVDGRTTSDIHVKQSLEICEFLRKCSVFESMTPNELTEVSQKVVFEEFAEGDLIIRQGDEGDKFYIMWSGSVNVVIDRDGEAVVVDSMGPGDSFGEAALLTGDPRNATIVATSKVQVYSLDKASFQQAVDASATFREQLQSVFFQRM